MSNPGLTNLKCWWKLDEPSGTRYDGQGNVNLLQAGGVGYATGHQTFTGNCADFVASNDEYLYTTSSYLRLGNFPIGFGLWIKPHDLSENISILSKWNFADDTEYMLSITNSKIRFQIKDENDEIFIVDANTFGALRVNYWHFVGVYFDSGANEIGVGVNDVWDTTPTSIYGIDSANALFILASWHPRTSFYDGHMDELFFYSNRLLNSDEWTWLYNNGYGRRFADVIPLAPPSIDVATIRQMPEIYVYDQNLDAVGLIDTYSSLNWAERYNSEGDFELELPLSYVDSPLLAFGNFLYIGTSDKLMIIEEKKPSRSPTDGKLLVNGRSVESILRRRTQLRAHTWFAPAEYIAYYQVYWNLIDSGFPKRVIDLFESGAGTGIWPPAMETSAVVSEQFASESIYEVIETVLKIVDLGFKIVVTNLAGASPKLYFLVYEGLDRSGSQDVNPHVIFSNEFENLLDSSFLTTQKDIVNVVQVVTEDHIYKTVFVWKGTESEGLNRFEGRLETTIDREDEEPPTPSVDGPVTLPTLSVVSIPGEDNLAAVGITTTPIIGKILQVPAPPLTDKEVLAIIEERGEEEIKEYSPLTIFDGDVDARTQFVLEEDFFLGDIVQVNAHGIQERARIIEIVKSYSVEGEKIYIAFDFEV